MPIQIDRRDDELAALLASPPYADDDAECLMVDLRLDRVTCWASPLRALIAAVHDDHFWAVLCEARRRTHASEPTP